MASKSKHTTTGPADLTRRMWVIEKRSKSGGKWRTYDIFPDSIHECTVVFKCKELAEARCGDEFRYRAATLTFDDDGRKCVIY